MYDAVNQFESILSGFGQQQKTISNNIANAHTPNYTRQTYSFSDVLGQMNNPYESSLSRKMGSTIENSFVTGTGQPVNLATEMVEMQKIFLNHSMVSRVLSGQFNNLRRATQIGR